MRILAGTWSWTLVRRQRWFEGISHYCMHCINVCRCKFSTFFIVQMSPRPKSFAAPPSPAASSQNFLLALPLGICFLHPWIPCRHTVSLSHFSYLSIPMHSAAYSLVCSTIKLQQNRSKVKKENLLCWLWNGNFRSWCFREALNCNWSQRFHPNDVFCPIGFIRMLT